MSDRERVLVTGGTGFVAGWCLLELLRRGHPVRATVRTPARASELWASLRSQAPDLPVDDIEVAAADLGSDDGWREATEGCGGVLHTASPFPPRMPRDPDALVPEAVGGTLRVLRAAAATGVRRVVLTSSVASIAYPLDPPPVLDEGCWTDPATPLGGRPYQRSKVLAEQAAWSAAGELPVELAVVCPGAVLGPPLGRGLSYSMEPVEIMLGGKMPAVPRLGFAFVDVRDLAVLHADALTSPVAAGRRYIGAGDFHWLTELAAVLRAELGADARKVPTRTLPSPLVRALARFQANLRPVVPELGLEQHFSAARARDELGWVPRPFAETVADAGRAVLARAA